MSRNLVLVRDDGPIRTLSLNKPERFNAIDKGLLEALDSALDEANFEPSVRVVVLRGEGRSFCAGDDLRMELTEAAASAELPKFIALLQRITERLMFGDKPVVCAVHGWAVGGGFSWTLNCDLSIWAHDARAYLPELSSGLFVSGAASYLVPRAMGHMGAIGVGMLHPRMSATEVVESRLGWRVVPSEYLLGETLAVARQMAQLPPSSVTNLKRAFRNVDRMAVLTALREEARACEVIIQGTVPRESLALATENKQAR